MAAFAVSKASYQGSLISEVQGYTYENNSLYDLISLSRIELIEQFIARKRVVTVTKTTVNNSWKIINTLSVLNVAGSYFIRPVGDYGYGDSLGELPKVLTRRKTFVSYYHEDDQYYKEQFEWLLSDIVINKSVSPGEIDPDNSTGYIKALIQNGYLHDTTVMIVLVSAKTKNRKHIDWEMSAALNYKVGDSYAGLIGLHLPHHSEYGVQVYLPSLQPLRLAVNAQSGYAKIYDWREDRVFLQNIVEDAFLSRTERASLRDNSLAQMQRNTCP